MDGKAAGSRKQIEIVCVLIVAGIAPLSGCAVPSTVAESIPAWMRPWQVTPVAAAQRDSAPANLAVGPTTCNEMRNSYPQSHPAMTPAGEGFASSAPSGLPPQLPYAPAQPMNEVPAFANPGAAPPQSIGPPVRLVSEQSLSPAAQSGPPQPSNAYVELARSQAAFSGRSVTRTVLHADKTNFDRQVLRSDVPVLVDFYASWCGPCKRLAPTLEEVAAESPGARVVKVNVDDSPELAERYDIHSMPSLLVFKNGRVMARQKGVVSKSRLMAMLDL